VAVVRQYIAAFFFIALVAGCVSSDMIATGGKTFPPRPNDYVIDVYATTDAPVEMQKEIIDIKGLSSVPPGAIEIGRVDANGAPAATWEAVADDAKVKARMLGGDGLIIKAWGQPMTGVDAYGDTYYGKALSMTVIRYNP
jgi:hypothetical protein